MKLWIGESILDDTKLKIMQKEPIQLKYQVILDAVPPELQSVMAFQTLQQTCGKRLL